MNEAHVPESGILPKPVDEPPGSPVKRVFLVGFSIALIGATMVLGIGLILRMVGVF